MQTQAAVLYAPNTPFVVETLDLAPPRAGEVQGVIFAGRCEFIDPYDPSPDHEDPRTGIPFAKDGLPTIEVHRLGDR